MLDIKLLRENKELVINNLKKRNLENLIEKVEECLELDNRWREVIKKLNNLRAEKNKKSEEFAKTKNQEILEEVESLNKEIEELEKIEKELKEKRDFILKNLPNIAHESVPYGKDENDNVAIRYFGTIKVEKEKAKEIENLYPVKIKKVNYKLLSHYDLMQKYVDTERAAKTSGSRFYFLKNEVVILNFALIRYGIDFLRAKGFTILFTPFLTRRFVEEAATHFSDFEDVIYKIENEDLYLIPTSEHSILGYHANEIIPEEELPLKYAGVSSCFRKEAGAHGKDTKGIFRVHQFEKVEQFVYSKPEESWQIHEELIKNAEEFYQSLKLPYRIVNICSGDLGYVAAKKYDLEAWFPGQTKYRELVSCSNCTDWQARRANIRLRRKDGKVEYLHTLNSTLVATERTICAIFENFYDGEKVTIPKPLRKYTGFKYIYI
ncbi:MAG: serine--tRNA ligase [Candidatus Aenigmatarchaeota archaeon]